MTTSLQNPQFAIACRIAVKRAGNVGHVLACMMHAYPHTHSQKSQDSRYLSWLKMGKTQEGMDALILVILSLTLACSLSLLYLPWSKKTTFPLNGSISLLRRNLFSKIISKMPTFTIYYIPQKYMYTYRESCIPPTSSYLNTCLL